MGRKSAAGSEEAISRSCSKRATGWEAPNLIPGGVPDFKERDDLALAHWYEVQLQTLKVPVHFNTCVDREMVLAGKLRQLILRATGSRPKVFSLRKRRAGISGSRGSDREKTAGIPPW